MKRLRLLSAIILLCGIMSVVYIRVRHGQANDSIAPVISMDQSAINVSVKDSDDVLLEGITAKDNKDGDVTDTLTIDNISTFNKEGKRYVTVAAFDSSNNVGKATREITYTDYHSPRFDIKEPLIFGQGATDYLENIKAEDIIDGDLTSNIHFADNTSISSDVAGDYSAVIQVKNSAGDNVSLPVIITILDASYDDKPRVNLKHYVRYTKKNKKIDYEKLMDSVSVSGREFEIVDGDDMDTKTIGSDLIKIDDDDVNYKKAGTYTVTYKVTIEQGDEKIKGTTRLIIVVEE